MWAAQGQKQLLKVFILNLSSWRQNVLLSISLAQASYTIVEDRLGMEHESWTSGLGELRGRLLASAGLCLVVSLVVAIVRRPSGGLSHRSPVSQVSVPLLRLCCSRLPFVGTLLPSLSCSFCLPGLCNTCFHTLSPWL